MQVERLGDARQQVRQEACELLLNMFSSLSAEYVLERLSRFWTHRAWKVRHGILQTVAEAISSGTPSIFASKSQTTYLITQVGIGSGFRQHLCHPYGWATSHTRF
jgi:hypothetical protein